MRIGYVLLACAGMVAAFGTTPAAAQDFPTRPVTMVVPFPPGGAGDILSRMMAPRLEQKWGKPLVVENKPGAGSLIGTAAVQKAAPDGYTLLIAPSGTMAINVTLYKALPYDPTTDFVPIALAAQTPFVLIVNPDLPVKIGRRPDQARQGKAGRALLRVGRARRAASPVRRTAQEHDRHPDDARAVQGQPAGRQRRGRRPCAADVCRSRTGAADDPGRQGAGHRRLDRRPGSRRCRMFRRSATPCRASARRPGR